MCQGVLCVHVHKLCEPALFGFVICKDCAEALPVCARAGACACVPVCRISLCVCVFVAASVREHGEMLFTAFSVARLHDGSQHRGEGGGLGFGGVR